ncbi:MAG: hypothetical protein IJA85_08300, partial [Clostridia bacterium]|nr:hypothetical protein [Clostridia bacterium]
IDKRAIGEFGLPFHSTTPNTIDSYVYPAGKPPVIKNLIIDGVTVLENADSKDMEQLQIFGEVGNLVLRNVVSIKDDGVERSGNILKVYPTGHVKTAIISDVFAVGAAKVIDGEERIDQLITSDVIAQ